MINKFHNFISESKNENWWMKHIDEIKDVFSDYKDEGILNHIEIGYIDDKGRIDTVLVKQAIENESHQNYLNTNFDKGFLLVFKVSIWFNLVDDNIAVTWRGPQTDKRFISYDEMKRFNFINDCSQLEQEWNIFFDLNWKRTDKKPVEIILIQK
jgi:hypothetical protein